MACWLGKPCFLKLPCLWDSGTEGPLGAPWGLCRVLSLSRSAVQHAGPGPPRGGVWPVCAGHPGRHTAMVLSTEVAS